MATTRKEKAEARTEALGKRASAYSTLAGNSGRARQMSEVDAFRAVPTELSSFNRATTVGGAPLSCIWLIHGPSMSGKSVLALALIRAFQRAKGLAAYVDAELAADTKRWFPALGVDTKQCLYVGRTDEDEDPPPLTYEEVVKEVDGILSRYAAGKREQKIPKRTPLIVVVDSISKMVPASLLANLQKDGGKALRGGVGRLQALMNTAWLAEVGTKVGDDDILFAVIAHEMEKESTGWSPDWKVRGGGALIYDSMMQVRVTYAGQVKDLAADGAPTVGKRHRIRVLKNKHGPAFQEATFYTSTGEGTCPMGLDRTREVVHEGLLRGTIEGPDVASKATLTLGSKIVWKGKRMTLKQLFAEGEVVEAIAQELDAQLLKDRDEKHAP